MLAPETTPPPATTTTPATAAATTNAGTTTTLAVDASAGKTKRIAGIAAAGLGVASIGVAIGMSVLAKQASDKLSGGAQDSMYDLALDRQGRADQNAAIALYAVGGAAIATGVVLYVLGWRDAHRPRQMALSPSLGAHEVGVHALVRF